MEEFIVLGLVPGTSIQIDFFIWLKATAIVAGIMIVIVVHRRLSRTTYTINSPESEYKVFVSEPFSDDTSVAI